MKNPWSQGGWLWEITDRATVTARRAKFDRFMRLIRPSSNESILDVGVTPQLTRTSNFLETWYPQQQMITAVTNEPRAAFTEFCREFPDVTLVEGDGRDLPFEDGQFDIVFSNAVVEHVGCRVDQKRFVQELVRVSTRAAYVTTWNRSFPIDSHTLLPFVHYMPLRIRNRIYRSVGLDYWADIDRLNLLSGRGFRALFPRDGELRIYTLRVVGVPYGMIAVVNNGSQDSSEQVMGSYEVQDSGGVPAK